jgi:outer membrane protein TolC
MIAKQGLLRKMANNKLPLYALVSVSLLALSACASQALDGVTSGDSQTEAAALAQNVPLPAGNSLGLKQFLSLIATSDESVRAQAIDVEIARQENLGAAAMFEPEFYAELNRLNELRQVSAEQFRSSSGTATATSEPDPFSSSTTSAKVGVRGQTKFGATVDLFLEMDEVANSLQVPANLPSPEYTARSGIKVSVPLLRGGGKAVNTADMRFADLDEKIAVESTRLVQAKRVYDGLRTYVLYQRAAQRVQLREQILAHTEQLAIEVDKQVKSGLRNTSDLSEARAQVAERRSLLTQARQERDEQLAAIQIFFSAIDGASDRSFVPSESVSTQGGPNFEVDDVDVIVQRRAEVRVQALEIEKREVEALVAENAAKAELNLVAEYSKSRLEADYVPFRTLFGSQNPYNAWRVGFEFRRGIFGNDKAKALLRAAELREEQAALTMSALRQKLAGEANSTKSIVLQARRALSDQSDLIAEQEKLVTDEKGRAAAGLATPVDVLTREIELLLAKEAEHDARAQLQVALNLAAHVSGKLLDAYGL